MGKSTLSRKICENRGYQYVGFDDCFDYLLLENIPLLMAKLNKCNKPLCDRIIKFGKKAGCRTKSDCFKMFYNAFVPTEHKQISENVIAPCVMLYAIDSKVQDNGSLPVLDGVWADKGTRKHLRDFFLQYAPKLNFDSIRKLMIYLDLGLDVALERYRRNDRTLRHSIFLDEEKIKYMHGLNQPPASDEMPNFEVLIINDEKKLDYALQRALGF